MRHLLKLAGVALLSTVVFISLPINDSVAGCVSWVNQKASTYDGHFYNGCHYKVIIKARFDNGYRGTFGPLRPGKKARAHPWANGSSKFSNVRFNWCDWSAKPGCTP